MIVLNAPSVPVPQATATGVPLIEAVMPLSVHVPLNPVEYSDEGKPTVRYRLLAPAAGVKVTVPETPTGPLSNDEMTTVLGAAIAFGASPTPRPATATALTAVAMNRRFSSEPDNLAPALRMP
jgi:hypothetical protein